MAGESIRVQVRDAPWEVLGSDRLRGIWPENIVASADHAGPTTLSFTLKVEAGARRPDLLPFTPLEFSVDGMLVWAGYVWQRPTDANNYNVTCRGWQFHMDDDLLERCYVHTRLSDFVDERSIPTAVLAANAACAMGQLSNERGLTLAIPIGVVASPNQHVGAVLDLGPDSTGIRIVVTASTSFNASYSIIIIGHNSPWWGSDSLGTTRHDYISQAINASPWSAANQQQTLTATIAAGHRYVSVLLYLPSGGGSPLASDVFLRIHSLQVFRSASYESGNASTLKADQVIKDALPLAPALNQSLAEIAAGTFSLPSFETGGYLTLRQIAEAVNVVENNQLKIGGGDLRTLVYRVKPTAPILEVGEWAGYQFDDATVSGEDIYTRAIIDGTGPDGGRLVSKRTQAGTLASKRSIARSKLLPVNAAVTQAVADRIGDLWLTEHRTAPFSGTLRVVGPQARTVLGGQPVPAHAFLLYTGEKVRLSNRLDLDTGGWGRDGRIAGVTYTHNERAVAVELDDQRQRFDTILSRYAALVGG